MTFDPNALKLYVDGSCKRRKGGSGPGPGGWALWAEFPDAEQRADEFLVSVGYLLTTNNRMELRGLIGAYDWIAEQGKALVVSRIQIVTDSKYVHDHLNVAPIWRAQGWMTAKGPPVSNVDLWKLILNRRASMRRTIHVIRTDGKKSNILRAVDQSAKDAAASPTEVDRGYFPGKVGKSAVKSSKAATSFEAKGQQAVIRIYRTTVLKGGGGINLINFNMLLNGEPTGKFYAYAEPMIGNTLRRGNSFTVLFNDDLKYPMIVKNLDDIRSLSDAGADSR